MEDRRGNLALLSHGKTNSTQDLGMSRTILVYVLFLENSASQCHTFKNIVPTRMYLIARWRKIEILAKVKSQK